jgi:ParB family chromosome partitioning protein
MAKIDKIALSRSQDIPFDKLTLSDRNVRRVEAGVSIEELAEDIARRTLLQSLSVRPIPGREGFYEVQAGGRRFRALELLVKQKRLAKNAPVPCVIREDGLLEEDSLAENVQRVNLHPLDQFRAFQALREQGLGDEEIAARFFVTPNVVRQRLKLASVSPKLLELYARDEMSLEQLMSFAVSNEHARQEQVWEAIKRDWSKEPYRIKRLLTESAVRASDKRARFVGVADYEAAGGAMLRDLFADDDGGWLRDAALLEKLVAEKLDREAEAIRAEGWKWVEVAADFPYGHTAGLRRIAGETEPLTDEERTTRDALRHELEELEQRYMEENGEDLPEDIDRRLAEIEAALDAFENRPARYDAHDVTRAGAFVSIDGDGRLEVERGYVRPEDEARHIEADGADGVAEGLGSDAGHRDHGADSRGNAPPAAASGAAAAAVEADSEDDGLKPLSERLVMELTAQRTLALRDALAQDPQTAFLAVLHALVLSTFYHFATDSCLEITAKSSGFPVQGPDLKECRPAKSVDARHEHWAKQLPEDPEDLWEALIGFDAESRMALFAHCASLTVNAVQEPWNRAPGRKRHADQLARALTLDMAAAGWRPTAENYLGRVPKARILEAVREAKGANAAELIAHLKKSDMAQEAERMLADSGWLPELLRTPGVESSPRAEAPASSAATATELPAFLGAAE